MAGIMIAALGILALPVKGQFPADSTLPRNKRTKREIAAFAPGPTPRTPDGKPDLSGVWGYAGYTSDVAKDYDVGTVPMTDLGEKLFKERQANEGIYDPEARCLPTGVPRRDPYPSKILQEPKVVVILFEGSMHSYRQIFLDRTTHPKDPNLHGSETPSASGREMNWWWIRWVLTARHGWIWPGTLRPTNFMWSSVIRGRSSEN